LPERRKVESSESGRATPHDFALTYELGIELCAVECEVDVEVNTVEGALGCVHALEIFLQVLAAQVGGESDNFLDACMIVSLLVLKK